MTSPNNVDPVPRLERSEEVGLVEDLGELHVVILPGTGLRVASLNATAVFQAGARSVDAVIEQLGLLHEAITTETAKAPLGTTESGGALVQHRHAARDSDFLDELPERAHSD